VNATALVAETRAAGIALWHADGCVQYRGPKKALEIALPKLAAFKAAVVEALQTEARAEAFEERAAIMEHDGGLARDEAEAAARLRMLEAN